MRKKAIVAWSGGKDSALALHEVLKNEDYEIVTLLTTITEDYRRISMHGVRQALAQTQAECLGYNLDCVFIPKDASNELYEERMEFILEKYKERGVMSVVFGDIFLEDVRQIRASKLATIGMEGIFPLWKKDTKELAEGFIGHGFKAIVTCVDSKFIDGSYAGRLLDMQFLSTLPSNVDPCGENGEYHSFVFDGPIFNKKVSFRKGEIVLRENRFYFCDLIPHFEDNHPL